MVWLVLEEMVLLGLNFDELRSNGWAVDKWGMVDGLPGTLSNRNISGRNISDRNIRDRNIS